MIVIHVPISHVCDERGRDEYSKRLECAVRRKSRMRSLIILTRSVGRSLAPLSLPFPTPLDDSDAVRHCCIESLLFSHVDTPREAAAVSHHRESIAFVRCLKDIL